MWKFAKKRLHDIREQAVADYHKCIVRCLEPAEHPVSLLDCGLRGGADAVGHRAGWVHRTK